MLLLFITIITILFTILLSYYILFFTFIPKWIILYYCYYYYTLYCVSLPYYTLSFHHYLGTMYWIISLLYIIFFTIILRYSLFIFQLFFSFSSLLNHQIISFRLQNHVTSLFARNFHFPSVSWIIKPFGADSIDKIPRRKTETFGSFSFDSKKLKCLSNVVDNSSSLSNFVIVLEVFLWRISKNIWLSQDEKGFPR